MFMGFSIMTDLLTAVDDLTQPSPPRTITQETSTGQTITTTITDAPLLDQLEESIRATIGIGGSGSLPNERSMLDGEALHQFTIISSTIKEWARAAGVQYKRQAGPSELLRAWYVRFMASNPSDDGVNYHLKALSKWAAHIHAKFDQPKIKDLPDRCPVCDAGTYWKDAQEYPRPLVIQYKEGADMIEQARGLCRACAKVWGARELAWALEIKKMDIPAA